jgi:hypothetical protein
MAPKIRFRRPIETIYSAADRRFFPATAASTIRANSRT